MYELNKNNCTSLRTFHITCMVCYVPVTLIFIYLKFWLSCITSIGKIKH